MSVACHGRAAPVGAARGDHSPASRPWRTVALGLAFIALALAAGEALSQVGGCARCGAAPPQVVVATPQKVEPRQTRRVAFRFELRPERSKLGAFGGSYVSGIVTRGISSRYGRDQMVSECVQSSGEPGAQTMDTGTGPTFSPAQR